MGISRTKQQTFLFIHGVEAPFIRMHFKWMEGRMTVKKRVQQCEYKRDYWKYDEICGEVSSDIKVIKSREACQLIQDCQSTCQLHY